MKSNEKSRRDVLRITGATAGAGVIGGLAGCTGSGGAGGSSDESSGDESSGGESAESGSSQTESSSESVGELNYWGISTTFPSEWTPFTDESGISINGQTAPWRQGQVINNMVRGSAASDYDVVNMDVTITRPVAEQGAIVNMDVESLPLWEETYEEVKTNGPTATDYNGDREWDVDAETGDQWAMTAVQNGDSVGYLPEYIGDPSTVSSYGILFDDEFNGKTSMEAGWATAFTKVANYLKYNNLADISTLDIQIPTEESIDTVMEFMLEQKDDGQFRTFWSGWESAVNLLASGEVWAMGTWEPVVFALRNDQNIDAQYLTPDEGWSLWGEAPWMTTGAVEQGKRDAVRNLVNWMIDGYYGAEMIELRGYLPASARGIQYAEENDGYDAEFHANRHELVRAKLQDERSVYGYNFPDPETFQYVNSQWSRLSG
ncbi:ABC transporter substrate-binding protein [Salinigranum halophilum]|jgi:putative spermidine/putrescine transport system substrate-binding protein|uniref:ABC transporter substrate-binding protein n=1 Tax=Salinigranum halophilum TaxID=2565931 RepID=UPI00115E2016|nr:PotD/PotF family extracellular solute-binding protein [Salinigranum halophilum]